MKDATTNETIVGASIMYATGKGAVTDIDGNFSIKIDSAGEYTLTISYVGYAPQQQKVKVAGQSVRVDFSLKTTSLDEVEVVADVAKTRETPVAISNISIKQIQEELGTKDLAMVLNSTPGAYATEQGGGAGDARVSIRGFDQRNVAVMVDGIPVNDMENGQVYWSNWDGLSDITRTMQVQRGLGASKLAIASVGGTINIITKGIDQKMGASIKQEINNYGLYKTSFGINSGLLKGGWGITLAGSRKWGNGYADATFDDAWSYFIKIQKRFKKQLISLSVNGAPQKHGQRADRLPIAIFNEKLATKLGANVDSVYKLGGNNAFTSIYQRERGLEFNPNWGMMNNETFNDKMNYFHKPQFNLSHFWTISEKLNWSNVLYLSIGKGGGTGLKTSSGISRDTTDGQWNFQDIYDNNSINFSPSYSTTEHSSTNYLRASNNDHFWYGLLSSLNYTINKNLSAFVGVDLRYYKGSHYQSVYNLMGGDYALESPSINPSSHVYISGDANLPSGQGFTQNSMKLEGDKISYYNDAIVKWGGLFGQVEYKKNKWSMFLTASVSKTGYQRIDYFKRKDLIFDNNSFAQAVGYGDVFYYNGTDHLTAYRYTTAVIHGDTTFVGNKYILNAKPYTNQSSEAKASTTAQKWFLGYTIKGGANYNLNEHMNAFANIGYMNIAPRMNLVFDNNNKLIADVKSQKVFAVEGGYGLHYKKFAGNINLYYTSWKNKPPQFTPTYLGNDGERYSYNLNGLDAVHKGIEIDFIYKLLKNLDIEALASIGDWKTVSAQKVFIYDDQQVLQDSVDFSAKNVHVGDAAQIQYGLSLRYEIIKGLYIKPRFTYFGKNYANFDPLLLEDENKDRESWKMPNYGVLDVNAGYDFKIWKMNVGVIAGVSNVLNAVYITDAQNGSGFNASTATVYMGMGRRFNVGLKIGF